LPEPSSAGALRAAVITVGGEPERAIDRHKAVAVDDDESAGAGDRWPGHNSLGDHRSRRSRSRFRQAARLPRRAIRRSPDIGFEFRVFGLQRLKCRLLFGANLIRGGLHIPRVHHERASITWGWPISGISLGGA
jgi:hypothetical protein